MGHPVEFVDKRNIVLSDGNIKLNLGEISYLLVVGKIVYLVIVEILRNIKIYRHNDEYRYIVIL